MLKISPTFVNRSDLRQWEKYLFTLEERVETNVSARRLYRRYYFLPQWLKNMIEFTSIVPAMFFLMPWLWVDDEIVTRFGGEVEDRLIPLLLASIPCVYGALVYFTPFGWIPTICIFLMLMACRIDGIFHDYERELERTSR